MSSKKPSGYLTTDGLANTLDLPSDSKLFLSLLKRIRQISQQIFNPHETYEKQEREKIAEFSAKMSQEFADVLQGPTLSAKVQRARMAAVLVYCSQHYKTHRVKLRKKEQMALTTSSPTPPSTRSARKASKTSPHKITTPSPTLRSTPSRPGRPRKTPCVPSPTESRHTNTASQTVTTDERTFPRTPSPPPSTSSSATLTQNAYSALIDRYQARKPQASISDIAEFLGTCDPDMRYLLPSFMAFGCRNVEFLINISCQKEEDIVMILRKIISHSPPVEGVDEMDLLVVTRHFKEYFFGQSKSS